MNSIEPTENNDRGFGDLPDPGLYVNANHDCAIVSPDKTLWVVDDCSPKNIATMSSIAARDGAISADQRNMVHQWAKDNPTWDDEGAITPFDEPICNSLPPSEETSS